MIKISRFAAVGCNSFFKKSIALMVMKSNSIARVTEMGCCGCFGFSFTKKTKKVLRPETRLGNHTSQELLLNEELEEEEEEEDDGSYNGDVTDTGNDDDDELPSPTKRSEEIILYRTQNGLICREFPVKETHVVVRSEVLHGMNAYIHNFCYCCLLK